MGHISYYEHHIFGVKLMKRPYLNIYINPVFPTILPLKNSVHCDIQVVISDVKEGNWAHIIYTYHSCDIKFSRCTMI